ncbi:hypothetical protein L210DRAFT_3507522 [Boletus edulis BED1]|uniref:Uncharacterized protein n=1 Tax=Boletus edulis BED1 TaxID=1328754 RepID=A0AAD4G9E5_BOLED|nr:hypothetical protein L210DRAFT_3507522 [Boletus edulis BED1]
MSSETNEGKLRSPLDLVYIPVELKYILRDDEFNVIGAWRQSNPDVILECVALDALDFDSFYRAADETDPTWSGVRYRFMYNKVNDSEWQTLADLAAKHFGLDIPVTKKKKGKGKGKAQIAASPVTAIAGPSRTRQEQARPATAVAGPSRTRQEQAQPATAVVGESHTRQEHNPIPLPSISSNTNLPSHPTMPDVGPVTVPSRDDVDIAPTAHPSRPPSAGPSRRPPAQSSRASSTIDPTPTIRMPDMSIMEKAMGNNILSCHNCKCMMTHVWNVVRNAQWFVMPTMKLVTVTTPITTQIVHSSDLHEPSPRDAGEEHDSESVFHSVHPRFNISFRRSWDVSTYSSRRTSPEPELCSGPASPFIVPTDIESEWNTDEEDINIEVYPRIHCSLGQHWRPPPYDPGFAEFTNNDGIEWETEGRRHFHPPLRLPWKACLLVAPHTLPDCALRPHMGPLGNRLIRHQLLGPPCRYWIHFAPNLSVQTTIRMTSHRSPETFNNLKSLLLVSEPQMKSTPLEKHSRDSAILDERRPFPSPKKGRKKSLGESESEGNVNMKVEGNSDPSSPYDFESVTLIVLSQKVNAEKEVEGRGLLDGMDIIRHLDKNMDEMEHIKKELRSVYGTTGAVFHRSA